MSWLENGLTPGVIAGMVFMLCGLGFKISAAPFHMWTPDVYEGAPTPVTGFFASAPKFAAMALIARLVMGPFGGIVDQWQQVIIVFAVLSMFIGALGALTQTNIKRLMAHLSAYLHVFYRCEPEMAWWNRSGICRGFLKQENHSRYVLRFVCCLLPVFLLLLDSLVNGWPLHRLLKLVYHGLWF